MTDFMLIFRSRDEPPQGDIRYDLSDLVERYLPDVEEDSGVWHFPRKNSENHMTDWRDRNGMAVISFRSVYSRREQWSVVVVHGTEEIPQALKVMQRLLEVYKPTPLREAPRPFQLYYSALEKSQRPLSQNFYAGVLSDLTAPFSGKPVA